MLKHIANFSSNEDAVAASKQLYRQGIITYVFKNNALNKHFIETINRVCSSIN